MTALGVGLFRQIARLHRHAELVLAHDGLVRIAARVPRGLTHARPSPHWSAFCLMRLWPATGRHAHGR
ncbi:hypothetical protein [Burkholderia singularis]|uniref:hypothetical protein n=1 Tax=Burkholderia singularis TaxID=1503053 RepID=UPI0009EAD23E